MIIVYFCTPPELVVQRHRKHLLFFGNNVYFQTPLNATKGMIISFNGTCVVCFQTDTNKKEHQYFHVHFDVEYEDKHLMLPQLHVPIMFSFRLPMKVSLCFAVIIFIGTNIASAVSARKYQDQSTALPLYLLYIRVAINDTLFVIMGLLLSFCIIRIVKISAASVVLEAKVMIYK